MSAALLCRLVLELTDTSFLGHLGTSSLAGGALANLWIAVTSAPLWMSFGDTLNSMCSQAVGAGRPALAGVWLQVALVWVTVLAIPVAIAWQFTEPLMRAVGFGAEESQLAGEFAHWYTFALFPMLWFVCINNFLQALKVVYPAMVINAVLVGVNVVFNGLFIYGSGWGSGDASKGLGFKGSPIATSLARVLALLALLVYVRRFPGLHHTSWTGWSWEALSLMRARQFVLGKVVPLAVGNLLEQLQLQVMAFLAANVGEAALSAHAGMMQLFFVVTSGLYGSVKATIVRVGNHLGRRDVPAAKRVAVIDLLFSTVLGIVVAILFLALGRHMGTIFSDDPEVLDYVGKLSWMVGLGYAGMTIFYVAMAVLLGQGRSKPVMIAFLVGAWVVAVPLAILFTRVADLGLVGLWGAMIAGYIVIIILAATAVVRGDWDAAAEEAYKRALSVTHGEAGAEEGGSGEGGGHESGPDGERTAGTGGLLSRDGLGGRRARGTSGRHGVDATGFGVDVAGAWLGDDDDEEEDDGLGGATRSRTELVGLMRHAHTPGPHDASAASAHGFEALDSDAVGDMGSGSASDVRAWQWSLPSSFSSSAASTDRDRSTARPPPVRATTASASALAPGPTRVDSYRPPEAVVASSIASSMRVASSTAPRSHPASGPTPTHGRVAQLASDAARDAWMHSPMMLPQDASALVGTPMTSGTPTVGYSGFGRGWTGDVVDLGLTEFDADGHRGR